MERQAAPGYPAMPWVLLGGCQANAEEGRSIFVGRDIIIAVMTFVVGFLGTVYLGGPLNWPDAGAIVAIAFIGFFILRRLDKDGKDDQSDS